MSRGPTLLRADTRNDIAFIILHPSYSADISSPLDISFRKKKKRRGGGKEEGRKKNEKRRKRARGGAERERERNYEHVFYSRVPPVRSRVYFSTLYSPVLTDEP